MKKSADNNKPFVNKRYLLERFQAKGGWTYARIPEILQDKSRPFGWVRVKGSIAGYEIKNYHLMPMGNGELFLPVKAAIRKAIGKKEGDWVNIILYPDDSPAEIPEELLICLMDEPAVHKIFLSYTCGEQKAFIDRIYAAKREETKVKRIAAMLKKVAIGERYHVSSNEKM